MALSITSDLADISLCNSTTDNGTHYRLAGTTSGNPAADADTFTQGTACIAHKMGATAAADVGGHFNHTTTFDLTNKHIYHWRFLVTAGNMASVANRGIGFGLTNTSTTSTTAWSTTNYKLWIIDGSDRTPISNGWTPVVIDPTSAGDYSQGALTLNAVKNVGFICRQTSGVTTTLSNQFYDAIRAGTGLTVTAGSAGDTATFALVYATDTSVSNSWGIITQVGGIYYGAGKINVGSASQTNTCLFKDTNQVFLWRNWPVATTFYEVNLIGASGFITTFQLGNKDGSGNTSDGCVVRGQGTAVWTITCGSYTTFKAYSSLLSRVRAMTLSSTSELKNCSISDSGTIDTNGATLTSCQFSGQTATQLKVDAASEMTAVTGCTLTSSGTGYGIEITAAGTYAFSGIVFNGYGADETATACVYNNSGGSVTINVSGGSTPTVKNSAGSSTTVNSTVTVTLTGLKNPTEVRVFNQGTTTERSGTGAENVTSGSHAFDLPSGTAVDISILALGYQNMRLLNYSTTSNTSIPISQVVDRQYLNP